MNHTHFVAFSEGTYDVRDFMQISFIATKTVSSMVAKVTNFLNLIYREPGKFFVLVIAWFGGQLRINFLNKILKFLCNCLSL